MFKSTWSPAPNSHQLRLAVWDSRSSEASQLGKSLLSQATEGGGISGAPSLHSTLKAFKIRMTRPLFKCSKPEPKRPALQWAGGGTKAQIIKMRQPCTRIPNTIGRVKEWRTRSTTDLLSRERIRRYLPAMPRALRLLNRDHTTLSSPTAQAEGRLQICQSPPMKA